MSTEAAILWLLSPTHRAAGSSAHSWCSEPQPTHRCRLFTCVRPKRHMRSLHHKLLHSTASSQHSKYVTTASSLLQCEVRNVSTIAFRHTSLLYGPVGRGRWRILLAAWSAHRTGTRAIHRCRLLPWRSYRRKEHLMFSDASRL